MNKWYLDENGKFVLDVMANARKLPEETKRLYLDAIMAALKAASQGRIDLIEEATKTLEERR